MSKDSSSKYYQDNKDNTVVNDIQVFEKMKNKSWSSIEKKCYRMRKNILVQLIFLVNIRNCFHLENLGFLGGGWTKLVGYMR